MDRASAEMSGPEPCSSFTKTVSARAEKKDRQLMLPRTVDTMPAVLREHRY
jgi:hypothetical protein